MRHREPLSLNALLLVPSLALAALACVAVSARQGVLAAATTSTLVLVPVVFRLWTRTWYRGLVVRGLGIFFIGMHVPLLLAGALAYGRIGCAEGGCPQLYLLGVLASPIAGALSTVVYWLIGRPPV
ncbi:hypothetical protein OWM54_17120 [Myxococcus sp. MISCRS1]|jgi:hypothetical protein|uniref:hypothetical protein n=1 Tax=Myxococcus TaxID=32 RepID=UPI0011424D54|nr:MULTISPECIES: hypothetical protein [unclassified Myxococcus]MBZ4395773.1 hypothetical protein [Myxococcus sp. AS-1-15]MBZ4411389.1 hypothetical protein [Myxococcus sp. XM-1-1-1]MCY0998864.1 hypothetical protein [Myxococcus sp. MISCRS1]